jgi:hypothetical protein
MSREERGKRKEERGKQGSAAGRILPFGFRL